MQPTENDRATLHVPALI